MLPDSESAVARARSATAEELKSLLQEAREEVLRALLENPHLEEPHVARMLERLDLPAPVLAAIAQEGKWTSSEGVRLRLARHPRTPKRLALAAVRQLFLFDLVRLSLLPSAPADVRRVAEEVILTRVPHLAIGEKLTLARRGPARVTGAILAEGHLQAIKLALANAFLTESQVLKVLAKASVPERVVAAIAQHPKWSSQYTVRIALVRNPHTPAAAVQGFLPQLTPGDLNQIARLEGLAPHLKKQLRDELLRRSNGSETAARGSAAREIE
ncbi:MAG TPA: hypothetical protein VN885_03775 [Candidatus Acidoferrales bacterium]|nr:hypothetical protein [Candidatus Acidoferrales bacterium]